MLVSYQAVQIAFCAFWVVTTFLEHVDIHFTKNISTFQEEEQKAQSRA